MNKTLKLIFMNFGSTELFVLFVLFCTSVAHIKKVFADDTQEPRYHEELFASCEIEDKFGPGIDQYILEQFKKGPIDPGLSWVWRRKLRSTENGRGSEKHERLGWIDSFVTGTAEHPSLGIALRSPSVRWAAKTIHIYSEGKQQNETIILIPDRDRDYTQKTSNCKINHALVPGKAPPFEEPNKYPCWKHWQEGTSIEMTKLWKSYRPMSEWRFCNVPYSNREILVKPSAKVWSANPQGDKTFWEFCEISLRAYYVEKWWDGSAKLSRDSDSRGYFFYANQEDLTFSCGRE